MKADQSLELLQAEVEKIINPLGYEAVALEQSTLHGARTIVLFIDFLENSQTQPTDQGVKRIGLDDCIAVNKAVDELFETTELIPEHFTLEVSSPGVQRPLRKTKDYARFSGRKIRLHTYAPLESEEIENEIYLSTHKKQKNFVGLLDGLTGDEKKVRMIVDGEHITIPVEKISKAHLEADFNK